MNDYVENVLSRKIHTKVNKNQGAQEVMVDPATLLLIAKISVAVIKTIRRCRESDTERTTVVKAPTASDDKILKRIVRKQLGWFKYMTTGGKIVQAMKEMGTELTENELEQSELYKRNNFIDYNGERYYEI